MQENMYVQVIIAEETEQIFMLDSELDSAQPLYAEWSSLDIFFAGKRYIKYGTVD